MNYRLEVPKVIPSLLADRLPLPKMFPHLPLLRKLQTSLHEFVASLLLEMFASYTGT